MDGIVAKRCLKKSYYERKSRLAPKIDSVREIMSSRTKEQSNIIQRTKEKILYRLMLQSITIAAVLVIVFAVKIFKLEVIKSLEISRTIAKDYNKSYTKEELFKSLSWGAKKSYFFISPVIPDKLEKEMKTFFSNIVNKKGVNIYGEDNNDKNNTEKKTENNDNKEQISSIETNKNNGVGGGVENTNVSISVASSLNSQQEIIERIKATRIVFCKPTTGEITSKYGAREKIFEGIDSFHTGTDIANNIGTEVSSSIDGKVIEAKFDKYNGNYIEVKNADIITRYCHLNKILVSQGSEVKRGQKIGQMGSTGLSTGPHLHFEIMYKNQKVDPEKVLEL